MKGLLEKEFKKRALLNSYTYLPLEYNATFDETQTKHLLTLR